MKVRVFVTLKEGVLDPQGQAVARSLGRLGFPEVQEARIGKFIELQLSESKGSVDERIGQMCEKLLANTVIENFSYEIVK